MQCSFWNEKKTPFASEYSSFLRKKKKSTNNTHKILRENTYANRKEETKLQAPKMRKTKSNSEWKNGDDNAMSSTKIYLGNQIVEKPKKK